MADLSKLPNHDSEIYAIVTIFVVVSFIAVVLRLYSRRLKGVALSYDDGLVIIAWIVTVAEATMVGAAARIGGLGRHMSDLDPDTTRVFYKGFYSLPLLQCSSLALSKISVCWQLHRIFEINRRFQWTIRILGAIVLLWWISLTFAYALICIPISANWDHSIENACGNLVILNLAAPIAWILTDFAILIAPIPILKGMQLARRDKIGIIALFLTGGCTCIVACIRYGSLFFSTDDLSWTTTPSALWSVVETNVTVLCACIITIRPALRRLFPHRLIHSIRTSWPRLRTRRGGGGSVSSLGNPSMAITAGERYPVISARPPKLELPFSANVRSNIDLGSRFGTTPMGSGMLVRYPERSVVLSMNESGQEMDVDVEAKIERQGSQAGGDGEGEEAVSWSPMESALSIDAVTKKEIEYV